MSDTASSIVDTGALFLRHLTLNDTAVMLRLSQEQGMRAWIPNQVYADEAHAVPVDTDSPVPCGLHVQPARLCKPAQVTRKRGCRQAIAHISRRFRTDLPIGHATDQPAGRFNVSRHDERDRGGDLRI